MNECARQFGPLRCSKLGNHICAFALNDAWPDGGDVGNLTSIEDMLIDSGFPYAARVYLLHEYDNVTDAEVRERLHPSYAKCVARKEIADTAKRALVVLTGDELPELDTFGRIVFMLDESEDLEV